MCLIGTAAGDLESFAKHAGRTTINTEDVMLLARRNDGLEQILEEVVQRREEREDKADGGRNCGRNKLASTCNKQQTYLAARPASSNHNIRYRRETSCSLVARSFRHWAFFRVHGIQGTRKISEISTFTTAAFCDDKALQHTIASLEFDQLGSVTDTAWGLVIRNVSRQVNLNYLYPVACRRKHPFPHRSNPLGAVKQSFLSVQL